MDVIVERFQRRKIVSNPAAHVILSPSETQDLRHRGHRCPCRLVQKLHAADEGRREARHRSPGGEIQNSLANGDKVKLNQLGTFHMTFRCPGMEASDKCTVRNISKVDIRFIPDKELKLVNGEYRRDRSPANVGFVLDKPEEGAPARRQSRQWFGGGSGDDGDQNENPLG